MMAVQMPFFATVTLIFLALISNTAAQIPQYTSVQIEQGTLVGRIEVFSEQEFINVNKEIVVFEGVPYAEPPTRFVHSVPKRPWEGNWNATYFRPKCYQTSTDPSQDYLGISEDCLYLNIYAPKGIRDAAVMVYFHGGGFRRGSGARDTGQSLSATGDVIVVNLNYRLGSFGFITTDDDSLPGNYGMMDQVQALKWVQKNIHAFGGDKDKVTIFGASAGGASVHFHILSKQSRGLFSRAIIQSGNALVEWGYQDNELGRRNAFSIGDILGCGATTSSALRKCLTEATAEELREADAQTGGFRIGPNTDGLFLEGNPDQLIQQGDFNRVPIMTGTSADEGTWILLQLVWPEPTPYEPYLPKAFYEQLVLSQEANSLVRDIVYQVYLDWSVQERENLDYFVPLRDYVTDRLFTCPIEDMARSHAALGETVYRYQFTHVPTTSFFAEQFGARTWTGTTHVEEIPYMFGYEWLPFDFGFVFNDDEKRLSVEMMTYWTNFAKNGEPGSSNPFASDYWPAYTLPDLEYKVINVNMTTGRALRAEYCHLHNDLIPKIRTFSDDLPEVERDWKNEFSNWKYNSMAAWQKTFNDYQTKIQHDEM